MSSISRTYDDIETQLNQLSDKIQWMARVWEGSASDGFQRTISEWADAERDLRRRLVSLHTLVATAYTNHAGAVRSNTTIWRV